MASTIATGTTKSKKKSKIAASKNYDFGTTFTEFNATKKSTPDKLQIRIDAAQASLKEMEATSVKIKKLENKLEKKKEAK